MAFTTTEKRANKIFDKQRSKYLDMIDKYKSNEITSIKTNTVSYRDDRSVDLVIQQKHQRQYLFR